MKINPLDPTLMKAWNSGRNAGITEARDEFHKFLTEKMQTLTDIQGIGEKTAWKIHEHFIRELEGKSGET